MPFGLWATAGPGITNFMGSRSPNGKGQFWVKGTPIVKYGTFCRELCKSGSTDRFVVWVWEGPRKHMFNRIGQVAPVCTSSILFARWHQCARRHSMSCAKTTELIELPFGLWTPVVWRKHMFSCIHWRAHWRHLTNTTEPSLCSGDAALCQITLTTCYYY